MQRVMVIGPSGSGKSTLAAELARRLRAPHVELDGFFHQADWEPRERDAFRADVAAAVAGDRWVVDGNYSAVRDLVTSRADTVVLLDVPRWVATARVIRRTAGRLLFRSRLWNGNRERLRAVLSRDPERSIIVWAWVMHPARMRELRDQVEQMRRDGIAVVVLRAGRPARDWLRQVGAGL